MRILRNIAQDKQVTEAVKNGLGILVKYLNKAKEWLNKIPKDKCNSAAKMAKEDIHKTRIDLVRNRTVNRAYLAKMHRLRMTLPSDITRAFEEIVNAYYQEYNN
jgi:ribosomal protein S25